METLNIQVELPSGGIYDMEELKRQLSDYAKGFIASQAATASERKNMETDKKRRPVSPIVSSLLGIAKGSEVTDLNGERAKEDFLREKYNESLR